MSDTVNRVVVRHLEASEKVLDHKSTGNYKVDLVHNEAEDAYCLKVMYTGKWGGGGKVEVYLLGDAEDADPEEMIEWFRHDVRGDHDVEQCLADGGFDTYTNPIKNSRGDGHQVSL